LFRTGNQLPVIPLFEVVGNTVEGTVAPKQKGFGVLKTGVITGFCKVTLEGKMVVQLLITKLKLEYVPIPKFEIRISPLLFEVKLFGPTGVVLKL
jgi:hypothetical protein